MLNPLRRGGLLPATRAALLTARIAAALAGLLTGGCCLLPFGGRPNVSPGGGPSSMGSGLRDFRVAFHCHSYLSHDSRVPFDTIAATARKLGFNAVILNDHYAPLNIARSPHGFWEGILFVPGVEIRPDAVPGGARENGSLLVFGIENDFPGDRKRVELMPELTAAGALVAAGHCEEFQGYDRYPLGAFEVYNLHAQFKQASRFGLALSFLFLFADPFFESQVCPRSDERRVGGGCAGT